MTSKILEFSDIINKETTSNIHWTDSQDNFVRWDWLQYFEKIDEFSHYLKEKISNSSLLVGIYHNNSLIWDMCNYALKLNNMSIVGLNHIENSIQIRKIIEITQLDIIICSPEQLKTLKEFWHNATLVVSMTSDGNLVLTCNNWVPTALEKIKRDYPISEVILTSGSTGQPKAYEFKKEQILLACEQIISFYEEELAFIQNTLCWMPLANPFQRMLNLVSLQSGKSIFYINDPKRVIEFTQKAKIEFFASVPRFYEKMYGGVQAKLCSTKIIGHYFQFVMKTLCSDHLSSLDKLKILGLHRFFRALITKMMGGKIKYLVSGSSPLPFWLENFFRNIGMPLYQAYGMSENVIPICLSNKRHNKKGSVGKALAVHKITFNEKKLLMKSPGLFMEFLSHHPNEYFESDDYGMIDSDGFVYLIGREADSFKTSTGYKIYPNKIENAIKQLRGVNYACMFGNTFKYPVAILDIEDSFKDIYKTKDDIENALKSVLHEFNEYELPKLVIIVVNSFSIESGELTSNLKLKRKKVIEKYIDFAKLRLGDGSNLNKIRIEYFQ